MEEENTLINEIVATYGNTSWLVGSPHTTTELEAIVKKADFETTVGSLREEVTSVYSDLSELVREATVGKTEFETTIISLRTEFETTIKSLREEIASLKLILYKNGLI